MIHIRTADEANSIVDRLTFRNRPPVNADVQREVSIKNKNRENTSEPEWHVGHKTGWEMIQQHYSGLFAGKTVGAIAEQMKAANINAQSTISSVQNCLGIWIDNDYKKNYADNEFAQKKGENLHSGGQVPHLKTSYEGNYNKGIRSKDSNEHRGLKRKYADAQLSIPSKATKEEKKRQFEVFKKNWDGRYPQSPLRESDHSAMEF